MIGPEALPPLMEAIRVLADEAASRSKFGISEANLRRQEGLLQAALELNQIVQLEIVEAKT